jgi:pyruvate dehydrogenase complex dehydrogenase (E1) component
LVKGQYANVTSIIIIIAGNHWNIYITVSFSSNMAVINPNNVERRIFHALMWTSFHLPIFYKAHHDTAVGGSFASKNNKASHQRMSQ